MTNNNNKPPMSLSQSLGSSSGWALDVIVVAPSLKAASTGVAASSDFYASFPASLARARRNRLTSTSKRLASFVSKKSISDISSSSDGGGEDMISERTQPSTTISPSTVTKGNVQVSINGRYISKLDMHFTKNNSSSCCRFVHGNGLRPATETLQTIIDGSYEDDEVSQSTCLCSEAVKNSEHHICAKINKPREAQSTEPILTFGKNLIRYTLVADSGAAIAYTEANIYLWSALDSVIVSDIDGTITKDNVGGVMDTVVQEKFEHIHNGICKFYEDLTQISRVEDMNALNSSDTGDGQIRFMYLSSRPITLVSNTRKLLVSVSQKCEAQSHHLPPGPMMCNVVPLSSVLYSELVSKSVHVFKSDVLARQVVLPFVAARGEDRKTKKMAKSSRTLSTTELDEAGEYTNARSLSDGINQQFIEKKDSVLKDDRLFLAGFGNTIRDAMAYEMAGIDRDDIYIIDTKSRIMCMGEGDQSEGQRIEDLDQDYIPDTAWVSDVAVAACCLGSSGESQVVPSNEQCNGDSHNVVNESNLNSQTGDGSRAFFDERQEDDSGDSQKRSNRKTLKVNGSLTQSIRAFTNKKTFAQFPSFGSSSSKSSKSSSKKVLYQGYDDPRLLQAVRNRIQGDYDPFPMHTKDS